VVKSPPIANLQNVSGNYDTTQNITTMRNIILLFLTIATINIYGQNHYIGIKCGASRTQVKDDNFTESKSFKRGFRTGLSFGLTYDYLFKKYFNAGADIIYNQRGFTNDIIFTDDLGNPTGKILKTKLNYDYVTIPLKVGFNYGKTIYGFINIYVTPSILIDAKTVTPTADYIQIQGNIIPSVKSPNPNNANKFDIGGLFDIGCGYKFKERFWLFTSLSYQQSFTTITNSKYFANREIMHYGMTLNLGLKFALTKE
jgi:hypothetical protein